MSSQPTIRGRVVLEGAGLAYYGLALLDTRSHFGGTPVGVNARDGEFVLEATPGTWNLSIWGPGTRRKTLHDILVDHEQSVDLGEIIMQPGVNVYGCVYDSFSRPVSGVRVVIGSELKHASQLMKAFIGCFETNTDVTGSYEFTGIDPHMNVIQNPRIRAIHPSGSSVVTELTDRMTIDLVLLPIGTIRGRVEGRRAGSVGVCAARVDEPINARTTVVRQGAFEFVDVPVGDYVLSLQVPESEKSDVVNVSVSAGKCVDVILMIVGESVCLTIEVNARDAAGLVLMGERSDATNTHRPSSISTIGNISFCAFEYVTPGDYQILINGRHQSIHIGPSPTDQRIKCIRT